MPVSSCAITITLAMFLDPGHCAEPAMPATPQLTQNQRMDFMQADSMLAFLQRLAAGQQPDSAPIDALMRLKGTALVIKQMNLARTVTAAQYRNVLSSLTATTVPQFEPADGSNRAARGVTGLTNDVWPALRWAIDNTDLLATRINALRALDPLPKALSLASQFLPDSVALSPFFYVVMGGRAGFAALNGDDVYFDLLAFSYYRAISGRPYLTDRELTEFLAHEMHHIGLEQIIRRQRQALRLDPQGEWAFGFLAELVAEGGASYLINGHRDLIRMRKDPSFSD